MKKHLPILILIILVIIFAMSTRAKNIDINTAKTIAINLFTERAGQPNKTASIAEIIEEKEHGVTYLYIVKYTGKGFAVVAGNDLIKPIVGYSFESQYNEGDHSPAFEFYILERYQNIISNLKNTGAVQLPEVKNKWEHYQKSPASFNPKGVLNAFPLLKSIWHQRWPYNGLCPEDTNSCPTCNDHALVGCVATAMAQVMKYWEHPWHGMGNHSYTPEDHPEYGNQSADFDTTYYNFDFIPDSSDVYLADLAELNYHCGVAVNMNYGPSVSGAWTWYEKDEVANALRDYFYFHGTVEGIRRSEHSTTWVEILKENLDLNRPVIYAAQDNQQDAGHAWVIDAYDVGDMFHCNWGWGGSDNGFFSIDNFDPGGYLFDVYEMATVNIFPVAAHASGTWTAAGGPYVFNYNCYVDEGFELEIEPGTEIIFNGRYKLDVKGRLLAIGNITDSIFFSAEIPRIGMEGIRFINLNNNSADSSKLEYCSFDHGKGEYTVVNAYGGKKGGAVYCENSSKVLISNCLIQNCQADYGGGIACYDTSNIRIQNCLIRKDTAIMGGGLYFSNSDPLLSHNIIERNTSTTSTGGGAFCHHADPTFFKDSIRYNSGQFGAGIGAMYSWAIFDGVIIHDNDALVDGGAMYITQSNLTVTHSEIYENTAADLAGGVLCYWNSNVNFDHVFIHHNSSDSASAFYVLDAHASLTNTTIADNPSIPAGQGIFIEDGDIAIENSILWNNGSKEIDTTGLGNVSINYSIVKNGNWTGTNVSQLDPQFADPAFNDYRLTWEVYPMPDGNPSPAIDAGNPSSPLDPDGTLTDLGAIPFEQVYTALPGGNISGTLTCDGSPYYVEGDLILASTDQLIIEPCVTMIFQGYYRFEIRGRILAEGTETDRITFAPADTIEGWRGLRFINTKTNGQDSSKLVNCRITFGNAHDSYGDYYRGGAIYSKSSGDLLVKNCLLNKNRAEQSGGAIYSTGAGGPFYVSNIIENNYAPNGGAMYGNSAGDFYFKDNLFQNNRANNGGALSAYSSNIYLAGNTIRNNRAEQFGGAIYYASGGNFFFDDTDKNQVYLNYAGGAGLDFYYAGYQTSTSVILDTFTVANPHKHFAYPFSKFNFTIDNGLIPQVASDLFVSMIGSDENPGTSESEPLKTMYMACLKILADEGNPRTIYLDEGTYSEGATGEVFPINWRSFVNMHGQGIEETTIYGEDKNQLLYCYNDSGLTIDSISFEGGYGEYGGGIRLENYSSPTLFDLEVKLNYAEEEGGGMYCSNHSDPVLNGIRIKDNISENGGGGICFYNYSNASMIDCYIDDNFTTYKGGGIKINFYSDVTIDSSYINHNTAVNGAGLYIDWDSDAMIKNSTIQNNQALTHVSGYFGTGGGIWISYYSDPVIDNVEILFNHADAIGGGIFSQTQSQTTVKNCWIEHNSADRGGGLYLQSSANHHYYNTVIANNSTSDNNGGGIYLEGNSSIFTNVTITGNSVGEPGEGGGLYNYNGSPVFKNAIFWNNSPTEIESTGGTVSIEYSDIEGGYGGTGNIDSDPQFTPYYGQFDIAETSPCVDSGNPDTTGMNLPEFDLGGNPRISNDRIDMGAYEYQFSNAQVVVDLKVFLEGPYNSASHLMETFLLSGGYIPTLQPYNPPTPYYDEEYPAWLYTGTETVPSVPNDVVDWVLVQLRDSGTPENATSATIIGQQAGFVLADGTVVGLDGVSALSFSAVISQNLYVVVFQRNHLGIMSAYPLSESGGIYGYDFTNDAGQVYGGANGHKEIEIGVWGMVAGDGNGNGIIQNTDETAVWKTDLGQSGYLGGDFDMNGIAQNTDETNYWKVNLGSGGQITTKTNQSGYRSQVPK
ncbi:MAG: C10 family peptidase [Bacteroidetes bacterium]|nr:C10 family peptidase [Bacteroidota bacterium]